ncbi:hypothetical protein GOP47_0015854 [Adiantum capillus-veneris]|uniref:Uncharacterized protein n=1 Tax=Adiantum capillus-veneris TaxID=13818 RepID=A0A9D4UKF6_ADICA|nr:hypothetical protein GOP47_0015854 [Adiantum capillus-veneris]
MVLGNSLVGYAEYEYVGEALKAFRAMQSEGACRSWGNVEREVEKVEVLRLKSWGMHAIIVWEKGLNRSLKNREANSQHKKSFIGWSFFLLRMTLGEWKEKHEFPGSQSGNGSLPPAFARYQWCDQSTYD